MNSVFLMNFKRTVSFFALLAITISSTAFAGEFNDVTTDDTDYVRRDYLGATCEIVAKGSDQIKLYDTIELRTYSDPSFYKFNTMNIIRVVVPVAGEFVAGAVEVGAITKIDLRGKKSSRATGVLVFNKTPAEIATRWDFLGFSATLTLVNFSGNNSDGANFGGNSLVYQLKCKKRQATF